MKKLLVSARQIVAVCLVLVSVFGFSNAALAEGNGGHKDDFTPKDYQGIPVDPDEVLLDPTTCPDFVPHSPGSPSGDVTPMYDPDDPPYNIYISGVSVFDQHASQWANVPMQSLGDLIGPAGCALCSVTTTFNKWGAAYGWSRTPLTMNSDLGTMADKMQWDNAAGKSGGHVTWGGGIYGFSYDLLLSQLQLGKPVIIGLQNPSDPSRRHWVVCYKLVGTYRDDTKYYVADSWYGGRYCTLSAWTQASPAWPAVAIIYYNPTGH